MSGFLEELTPLKAVAVISAAIVMIVVWLLNAAFTFTYGADVIGPFLLETQLGADGSALLSGVVALIFYDLSYTVGFLVMLSACRSVWQYAVTGLQFVACFTLSVLASVTSILLLSPLGNDIPEVALLAARYLGYAGLIFGFVVNAVATIGYVVAAPEMAARIAESVHNASQTADTEKFNKHLRKQARTLAHDLVRDDLPDLAAQEAAAIRANYLAGLPNRKEEGARPLSSPIAYPNGRPVKVEQTSPPAPIADGRRKEQPAYQVWLHNGRRAIHMIEETYDWAEAQGTAKEAAASSPPGHYIIIKLGDGVVAQYAAPEAVEESSNGRPT